MGRGGNLQDVRHLNAPFDSDLTTVLILAFMKATAGKELPLFADAQKLEGAAMDNWDEIRTAFQVARLGTVSGAADVLGVHHATVIRHIDALETRLGAKLFQRHARGYSATEAGADLLQVAQATDDQFAQLAGRIKGSGEGVGGELVVTSLVEFSSVLTPILVEFRKAHPDLTVRYLTGDRVFRLEYGEAHVALRAGPAPEEPDNVVQPFRSLGIRLMAARSYVEEHGMPGGEDDFAGHKFVGPDDAESRAQFHKWMRKHVSREQVVFRTADGRVTLDAIRSGVGIGFLPDWLDIDYDDLIDILPPKPEWGAPLWLVTHVDLHRTTKVQAFLEFLKERSKSWLQE